MGLIAAAVCGAEAWGQVPCATGTTFSSLANGNLSVPTNGTLNANAGFVTVNRATVFRVIGNGRRIRLSSCGNSTEDTAILVTRGCSAPGLGGFVAGNDDACAFQSQVEFDAQQNVEYQIFGGWRSSGTPLNSYNITVTDVGAATPVAGLNASCATPAALLVNDARGNEAVTSAAQPLGSFYSLTVNNPVTVVLEVCGASNGQDPYVEILSACGGSVVAFNDDGGATCSAPFNATNPSRLSAVLNPGQYIIRATGLSNTPLSGVLRATVSLPLGNFTYQGRLDDGGTPVNGAYDIRFNFYTGPLTTAIRGTFTASNVPVVNGLFQVQIPYTSIPNVTLDSDRSLQIAVRPAGSGSFTDLTRQEIGVAPVARVALNAPAGPQGPPGPVGQTGATGPAGPPGASGASPFTISGTNVTYTDGNLGIGTTGPTARLQVIGADASTGLTQNIANSLFVRPGFVGVGRTAPTTGAEAFGIGSSVAGYTGMYITGPSGAQPFYGYNNTSFVAWTYLDPSGTWHLYQSANGEVVSVSSVGNMGIRTAPNPSFALTVNGNVRCTLLTQTSSASYKDEVRGLGRGLEELMRVRPVEFAWNDAAPVEVRGRRDVGVIAEELAEVLPEAVSRDDEGKIVGVDYSRLTVLSVRAIQQLQTEAAAREKRLKDLEDRLLQLEAERK
jgi:hypothetical protein